MICLPKELSQRFIKALKDRVITPEKFSMMDSSERHAILEGIVGKDRARDVNALFESKLLMKDQQTGITNWAREVAGKSPEIARDMISRVNKMETVLKPTELKSFLADLAAKKVGADVTVEESAKVLQLAKDAQEAKKIRDTKATSENIRSYGRAKGKFGDYIDSLKPSAEKNFANVMSEIINVPKSALTSILHFSAAGVQLWGSIATPQFWKGAVEQFKYFANEENYKNAQADISGHPDYDIARRAGLGITSIDGKLNDREEAIQSSLLQKGSKYISDKTGLPDFIRASSRAFTGYMNYVRFGRFEDLLNAARMKGTDVSKGSSAAEDLADVVNSFSGRGKKLLGIDLSKNQAEMNALLFSPRKIAGAMDMFNPMKYFDQSIDPTARKAAITQLTGSLLATTALLTLGKLVGGQVETNPIGTNFGKIKIGNSTIDVTGGNASYVRLIAQLITNKEKSSTGKITNLGGILTTTSKTGKVSNTSFKAPSRSDQFLTYVRDHTAPVASAIWDWASGSNVVGQPVTIGSELKQELVPLVGQAFYDMYKNDPETFKKIWPLLPSIFGFSTQSNAPTITKKK